MTQHIVALDVGGANLKLYSSDGSTQSRKFPMWRQPETLADALMDMLRATPTDAWVVATMTGELADCFASKRQGVDHITAALKTAAGERRLSIYLTSGEFVDPDRAVKVYDQAAASNWHALANFVAQESSWRSSLLVDIGSTTCDVIPLEDGQVVAQGKTDTQRLLAGELVYVGAERTPLAALADELPYRNGWCPVAREWFATMHDVQLVLGIASDQTECTDTADGRPATRDCAVSRLGRCLCADQDEWNVDDAKIAAHYLRTRVADLLEQAIEKVYRRHASLRSQPLVLSGHGDWLLEPLLADKQWDAGVFRLGHVIGSEAARVAPAYALVRLAERW